MQTSSNKYIKLAEKYMDNVARHYDPVPQEGAIIDFAIWLDKQAAEHSLHVDACPACKGKRYVLIGAYHEVCEICHGTGKRQ